MNDSTIDFRTMLIAEPKNSPKARVQQTRGPLIEALRKLGIVSIVAGYAGQDGEGFIERVSAYGADSTKLSIEDEIIIAEEPSESMREVLDEFCWDCLMVGHEDFEDGEGGYGEITIEVATGKVTIDHNARFIEIDNTVSEV